MLYSAIPRISVEFVDEAAVGAAVAKPITSAKSALLNDVLRSSHERVARRKELPLRKEMQIKAHISKQIERRELYRARVSALPSPTATVTPATPPESPAVFHFTLPSPGLSSPLTLFENLEGPGESWIEHVDFRSKAQHLMESREWQNVSHLNESTVGFFDSYNKETLVQAQRAAWQTSVGTRLSLDQINARLQNAVIGQSSPRPSRLPAFLARQKVESVSNAARTDSMPSVQISSLASVVVPALAVGIVWPQITDKTGSVAGTGQSDVARAVRSQEMIEKLRRRVSAPAVLPKSALAVAKQQHPVLLRPGGF